MEMGKDFGDNLNDISGINMNESNMYILDEPNNLSSVMDSNSKFLNELTTNEST
jgi:hypothetical protein